MHKLTQANVKTALAAIGLTFRKTEYGEFRVAFREENNESSAYYTDDLQDAYDTGCMMACR